MDRSSLIANGFAAGPPGKVDSLMAYFPSIGLVLLVRHREEQHEGN
jgi:hypothetical protein